MSRLGLLLFFSLTACGDAMNESMRAPAPDVVLTDSATLRTGVRPDVQVVDVRSLEAYAAGHVPGSVHLDRMGLRATVNGISGQAVARPVAVDILEAAGVEPTMDLVFVGAENDTSTARVAWTLALFGASRVSLLDGGFAAWRAEGGEVSTEAFGPSSTSWASTTTRENLRVDKAWMLENHDDPDIRVYDVRSPSEFAAGHIPGATNVNWTNNLRPEGRFDSLSSVRTRHGDPTEAETLVVYCQSGARASVSWALLVAAGYDDVRLYDGSWNEWGTDPDTPKAVGP